jgi:ABC-type lipoprotein export system ATPase subunit
MELRLACSTKKGFVHPRYNLMPNPETFLKLTGVFKEYAPAPGGLPVRVIDNVNFALGRGESAAIVGPSGSGKSTLLNLIGALDTPTRGEVVFEGENLAALGEKRLAQIRNRKIGFIFQSHHLLPQCSVLENTLMPTLAIRDTAWRRDAEERSRALLEKVGLAARLNHLPGQLSGGERQRVAVVRALINQPSLLLADEPTGALDQTAAQALVDLLLDLNREQHVSLIVVTHAPELAARMGRQFQIIDGRLAEMRSNPTRPA